MCGRVTLSRPQPDALAAELGVPVESLCNYRPRYDDAGVLEPVDGAE